MLFAVGMMVLSISLIDFNDVMGEQSQFGSIGFMASFIVLILLVILLASKKVEDKYDQVQLDQTKAD